MRRVFSTFVAVCLAHLAASDVYKATLFRAPASDKANDLKEARGSPVYQRYSNDDFYYTTISIGTPPQPFNVLVVSSTSYLWVPDHSCACPAICGTSPSSLSCLIGFCDPIVTECCHGTDFDNNGTLSHSQKTVKQAVAPRGHDSIFARFASPSQTDKYYGDCNRYRLRYDSSKSSTYKADGIVFGDHFNFSYIDNFFGYGFVGYDTVRLGSFSVPKTTFGQATKISLWSYQQGVLGFGPSSTNPKAMDSPVVTAFKQGVIDQPIASLILDRSSGQLEMTYGGLDAANCGSVHNWHGINTNTDGYETGWYTSGNIAVGSASIKQPIVQYKPFESDLLATGQKTMYALLKGADIDLWEFDCAKKFDLTLTIDGHDYTFPSADLVVPSFGNETLCMLPISDGSDDELIVGQLFARNYCQALDLGNNKFGFAKRLP